MEPLTLGSASGAPTATGIAALVSVGDAGQKDVGRAMRPARFLLTRWIS